MEVVRILASSKDHLKVIAELKEFVEFEIERVYKRVDGDRMKLKDQISKCEVGLDLKASNSEFSELAKCCRQLDIEVQGTIAKQRLQDDKLAKLSNSKKLDELEAQIDTMDIQLTETANSVQRMQEEHIYKESYAEALSTKSAFPSCLSCGSKPSAASPKIVVASGLLGTDKKFYKGNDLYNNLMMPGMKRLTLAETPSFTEDPGASLEKKPKGFDLKKHSPSSGVIPVITGRKRTISETPGRFTASPGRAATSLEFYRDSTRPKMISRLQSRTKE